MGAEICTGYRKENTIDNTLQVNEVFANSVCYRKIQTKKQTKRKIRSYKRKIKLLEETLNGHH